ncbi:hypothetical protein [Streptomyces lunalinharesii]|uniref:Uncharacterized protein n=1 Tax=Streptomyces lunalinharesii TaxID=333384 RepID=A0ABN3RQR8_9ACTN
MDTTRMNRQKKPGLRIFAISAALGSALLAGVPTAAAATTVQQAPQIAKPLPASLPQDGPGDGRREGGDPWAFLLPAGHHHGGDGDCRGLVVLLCA